MEFRSNRGLFELEPFPRTLKNQFSFMLGSNSTTIFSNLNYGETLSQANQQGGFQFEEPIVGGSKLGQNSDSVTPPSFYIPEFNSIPATSELYLASEVGNSIEVGFQTPTQANISEFNSIPAISELYRPSKVGNPDELGFHTPTQANIGKFSSIPAISELYRSSEVGNPDELGLHTPTQATVRPTVESSAESKKGVRGTSLKPGNVEGADRLEWLPDGWKMVHKLRQKGDSAGMGYNVYYEPVTGRLFRSKTKVLEFLETETRQKQKSRPEDNNGLANVMLSSKTMEFPSNEVFSVSELFPQTLNVPTSSWPEPESLTAIDINDEANKKSEVQVEEGPGDGSMVVQNSQPQPRQRKGVVRTQLKLGKVEVQDQPEWLPFSWKMELTARKSGATAGRINRIYYEPKKGLKFYTKNEVLFYLKTGTRRSRITEVDDNSDSSNVTPINISASINEQNGSTSKRKKKTASKGNAKPLIGDETVPKQTSQDWDAAFTLTEVGASSSKVDGE